MAMIMARGTQAIPLLLDALANEETRRVRQRLLRILSEMGTEVGELVVERFDDDRWFVLRNLAMILGEVGDPSMVEQLSPLLKHADARVRQEAVASTIKLGGPQAVALLIGALDDEDPTIYLMAIHGLGYHGNADAVARIRKLLKASNFRGRSTDLVRTAAIAVGRLSDEESRGILTRLSRAPWFFRDRREAARDAAAWALATLDAEPTRKAPEQRTLAGLQPGVGSHGLRLRGQQTMGNV
jgi:HEAT repeat protein